MPQEVKKQIQKLQTQLGTIPKETGALEEKLKDASQNIEQYDADGVDAFIEEIGDEIRKLEVEFPKLTATLNRVMTALSNWGI